MTAGPRARRRALAELPAPVHDPEHVRAVTGEVLSRAEYLPAEPTLLDRFWGAISDVLGRVFETLAGSGAGSVVGTVAVLAIIVALAAVVIWLARGVRRDPTAAAGLDDGLGRGASEWLRDAEEAERAGRWRDGLRCRYRAVLAELAADGVVEAVPGGTAGEYLTEVVRNAPDSAAEFEIVTRAFELAWYGAGDTTRDDVEAFTVHARSAVDAALGRRVGAGSR
jgi:hypothetical protein